MFQSSCSFGASLVLLLEVKYSALSYKFSIILFQTSLLYAFFQKLRLFFYKITTYFLFFPLIDAVTLEKMVSTFSLVSLII